MVALFSGGHVLIVVLNDQLAVPVALSCYETSKIAILSVTKIAQANDFMLENANIEPYLSAPFFKP